MLADGGSATGGPEKAGNQFHRGRLSGPVGAEKSQHFARLNGKADRIDNEMIGVTLAQRTGLNHWHASLMHAAQHRKNATRRCLPLDLISPGTAGNLLQPAARPDCYGYSCASCDVYGCTVREAGCRMRPLPAPGTRADRDGFKQLPSSEERRVGKEVVSPCKSR